MHGGTISFQFDSSMHTRTVDFKAQALSFYPIAREISGYLESRYKRKERKNDGGNLFPSIGLSFRHLHFITTRRKKKRRKIPFSEISRTVQVAVSQDDATPATCPTSVLAGTTALGCSRLSFNEFFPSHPPSLPPISHPSISLADVIKRNVTRKFSGALRPGSDHCTYPRFIAVCTTHFARPPSIAARSRSTGYSRRSCHSIVSNLRS